MYASITKVAGSSASLRVARGKPKIHKIYRYTYTCLFLLAVAFRKDAEASYSRYLLHLQVVIVCYGRHRLSGVEVLTKNLKSVGMTLAKVKEQDGMTLAKVRHAQVSHAPH